MDIKNNYYFKNFETINIAYGEYWDFNLANDKTGDFIPYVLNCKDSCGRNIITDGLVAWFDINNSGTTTSSYDLTSLVQWSGYTLTPSSGFTLNDWGLTGVDNGRTDCLTGKTLVITSASTKLVLYAVTGYTITYTPESGCTVGPGIYSYPYETHYNVEAIGGCPVGNTICLNGGFYQGFFKLDDDRPSPVNKLDDNSCCGSGYTLTSVSGYTKWQVMPTEFPNGWSMETWIKWDNSYCTSGNTSALTLNTVFTGNSNFFFYIGTRAENKFWNNFSGETGYTTSTGIPLQRTASLEYADEVSEPNGGVTWFTRGSNFGCDCSCTISCDVCGTTTPGYVDPSYISGGQNWFSQGSSQIAACCSICNTPALNSVVTGYSYNYCDQLSENALGFRITNDGRIGYRKMTVTGDCYNNKFLITGTVMEEGYSDANVMPTGNTWTHIVVTYVEGGSKYGLPSGTLTFWVNGLAKYKVHDFIGLQLRALDEWSAKQIGVPFNMSWGGGTQGLTESQTFGGPDPADKNMDIEKYFAGTFEGELSQLRFYEKALNVLEVRNNFFVDCRRYCKDNTFGGAQIVQPGNNNCGSCKSPLPPYIIIPC